MRGTGLMAAMILLASCGGQERGNELSSNQDQSAQDLNQANAADGAEPGSASPGTNMAANEVSGGVSPCLMQGSDRLEVKPIRAVGTEPFWSARVEGRCVTYSTPEDQQGTRVWTRYSTAPNGGGFWIGRLGGNSFEMRTRPEAGCSDGMSDKSYPIAVELTVNGEKRRGCAEPL